MIFEIKHAKKSFDGLEVLKDISVSVDSGEVVAIIGPSGSGKSTLLRCATFLEHLDKGEIEYMGKTAVATGKSGDSVYGAPKDIREFSQYYGLVFQNFNLFPHFSVLKNITDPLCCVKGMSKSEAETIAYKNLDKMGLKDRGDAYPCQLSGGQQQRVAIARALAMDPQILFFDEPTSALDPELTGEILKVIRNLAAEKMTMVIVTHEMNFARDVADRIIFMDGGVIVEQGNAKELISNPQNERTRQFLNKFNG